MQTLGGAAARDWHGVSAPTTSVVLHNDREEELRHRRARILYLRSKLTVPLQCLYQAGLEHRGRTAIFIRRGSTHKVRAQ